MLVILAMTVLWLELTIGQPLAPILLVLVNRRSTIALSAVKLGVCDIPKTYLNRLFLLYRLDSLVLLRTGESRRILSKVTLKVRDCPGSIGLVCSHGLAWLADLVVLEQTCGVHDCVSVLVTIIGGIIVSRWLSHPCGHRSIHRSNFLLLFICFDICASIGTFMLLTWLTQAMDLIPHFFNISNGWRYRLRCARNLLGLCLTRIFHLFQLALLTIIKVLEIQLIF